MNTIIEDFLSQIRSYAWGEKTLVQQVEEIEEVRKEVARLRAIEEELQKLKKENSHVGS